jgi:hypothetical protein
MCAAPAVRRRRRRWRSLEAAAATGVWRRRRRGLEAGAKLGSGGGGDVGSLRRRRSPEVAGVDFASSFFNEPMI